MPHYHISSITTIYTLNKPDDLYVELKTEIKIQEKLCVFAWNKKKW